MSENPRAAIGGNNPPLADPAELPARLELEHAELLTEVALLDPEMYALPEDPKTDEEAAKISDFIVKAKRVAKRVEAARVEEGAPYLAGQRAVNEFFKETLDPLEAMTSPKGQLARRVGVYNTAKAERERAERLERERLEREAAEAARRKEQEAREEAERRQREADEAAARIRAAETAEEMEEAQADMRANLAGAEIARDRAEGAAKLAAKAERQADTAARQAAGDAAPLSRVSSGGSTSSVTKRWVARVVDVAALRRTVGPLGPYFSDDDLAQAAARAVRLQSQGGATPTIRLAGVEIEPEDRVNIAAARGR